MTNRVHSLPAINFTDTELSNQMIKTLSEALLAQGEQQQQQPIRADPRGFYYPYPYQNVNWYNFPYLWPAVAGGLLDPTAPLAGVGAQITGLGTGGCPTNFCPTGASCSQLAGQWQCGCGEIMFITILDIDLFRFESINDFVTHSLISTQQIKQLFDDNQGNFPFPIQLEQFVLDHIFKSNSKIFKRETFRDESLIDLYTSILNDLLHWSTYTHKQIICILTLIQGLLCQIERTTNKINSIKLDEAFIHSCSILMSG
ncbi:unnamed protein product, partial [Rotaria sp. Silwood1]